MCVYRLLIRQAVHMLPSHAVADICIRGVRGNANMIKNTSTHVRQALHVVPPHAVADICMRGVRKKVILYVHEYHYPCMLQRIFKEKKLHVFILCSQDRAFT